MRLARARAELPEENAATIARMPTFSITIAIKSSSRPKPLSSRARVYTSPLSATLFRGPPPLPIATSRDLAVAAYSYSAINAQGAELNGELHAPDLSAAREQLRLRGLLASRLHELRADVEGGLLLSEAMSRHPKIFERLFISMVEAGEAAGILDEVLDRVALHIEKSTQIKRRVKGAMLYPIMVLSFAMLVLTGLLLFLVPVFVHIFTQLGGDLPKLTQYVVNVSNLLKHKWYIIFPAFGGSLWGFFKWKKTEGGRKQWDRFKLRVPKIGPVVLKVTMARFSRTLSTLVAAGVDIIQALEITGQTSGNWRVENALADVRAKVHEGVPIAQPLVDNDIFPPMVSQMVKIGEETGELEKMLGKIADFYEDEVDAAIDSLTSIIEPLMMILVGMMVGVIVIAMYLPMFRMLSLVK